MTHTVDAIICSFNEEETIEECLSSVLEQSLLRINPEMVSLTLADSASSDDTVRIALQTPGLSIIVSPKGKLSARDDAIRNSNADIIISLDADCVYPPDFFERLLSYFEEDPEVSAVCGYMTFDNSAAEFFQQLTFLPTMLGLGKRMLGGASAFRRQTYIDSGGFDMSTDQQSVVDMVQEEELFFGVLLSQYGKYVYDPSIIAKASSRRYSDVKYQENRVNQGAF